MSTKYREMVQGVTLTGSAVSLYTAPASVSAAIHAASVSNTTAAAVTVTLYKVPAAGSAAVANAIATRVVPANGVLTLHDAINHKLEPGTQLYALGAGCGLSVSGVEYIQET